MDVGGGDAKTDVRSEHTSSDSSDPIAKAAINYKKGNYKKSSKSNNEN